jgi:hypothetical protein
MARFAVSIVTLNRLRCCPGEGARAVAEARRSPGRGLSTLPSEPSGNRSSPLVRRWRQVVMFKRSRRGHFQYL